MQILSFQVVIKINYNLQLIENKMLISTKLHADLLDRFMNIQKLTATL